MPRGFLVGRLFGTDIYCAPGFFLLIGIILLINGAAIGALFAVAILISLLVHEFGHVFAVKWFMKEKSMVILVAMGGVTVHGPPRGTVKQVAGRQVGISLMGPAFGFALGIVSLAGYAITLQLGAPPAVAIFWEMMIWINFVWTLANLLPIFPLDGGQAAQAGLSATIGRARASRIMRVVSIAVAGAVMAGALALGERYIAVIAGFLIFQNLTRPGVA